MSNKKLNILILAPLALENGRGGEISAMELAAGLKKDYNIIIMDTNIFIGKKLLTKEAIYAKIKNIRKERSFKFATLNTFHKVFTFPYPWEIYRLSKIIRKQDIIYTSLFTIKFGLILVFYSLIFRQIRFIIGHRKPIYSKKFLSLYNVKYRVSILIFSIFKKRFYHHTISYHAKKYLENFYEPYKVYHIIHGIEMKNFIGNNKITEKNNKVLKYLYVGYLDDVHKGVGILLKAIRKVLKEKKSLKIFFEFCGEGPLVSKLKKLEREFPEFIKYHGYISNIKISEYYKRSDVLLFSSRREPFGRVIIEALSSKLIIICNKTFGSVEILKNKDFAFFLDELSSEEIKKKIDVVYKLWSENPNKLRQLQQLAKDYAVENYSFKVELEMFRKLIEKLRLEK